MKKKYLSMGLFIIIPIVVLSFIWNEAQAITRNFTKVSIPFITNQGQTDEQARFYARAIGSTVFITKDGEIVYSLHKVGAEKTLKALALKEMLYGGIVKDIKGEGQSITKVNYFVGKDPSKWRSNIPAYEMVNFGEVYRGIELKLRAYGNNVEKLFYIKPDANPEDIKIRLKSAKGLRVNESGGLEVETELGTVTFTKPVAYQEIGDKRVEITAEYVITRNEATKQSLDLEIVSPLACNDKQSNEGYKEGFNSDLLYGFKVGEYDRTRELMIDPLLASTYLGGRFDDYANATVIGSDGSVYVTGAAFSDNFPTEANAVDPTYNNAFDVFVSRFTGDLSTLRASTFLGGSGGESANAIAIKNSGKVYVAGKTISADFPTTSGAFDRTLNTNDAFISKFDADLTTLLASTYLGGSNSESATSMVIASDGSVYASGETLSADFPVKTNAADPSYNGALDAFVSKFSSNLSTLLASTFLGGSLNDTSFSIVSDIGGNIYVAGRTLSGNFPTISGAFDPGFNGFYDAFISKLNGDLTTLVASTYLGGGSNEKANTVAVTESGKVFVAGETLSSGFPVTDGSFDTSYNGSLDAFVSKLDGSLTTLIASTFLGGGLDESATSIARDLCGNVYVTGYTRSSDFPATENADDPTFNGGPPDAFLTVLKGDLSPPLQYSSFLGGSGSDAFSAGACFDKCFLADIAINPRRLVFVAGETDSLDFPTTTGAFNEVSNGGREVFVSRLNIDLPVSPYTLTVTKAGQGFGTVTSEPAGIDCGSVCIDTSKACTQVSLTATPDTGSTFAGWSGICTGRQTCTLTMNVDQTVEARFKLCAYSISPRRQTFFASGGKGSVSVTTASDCAWSAVSNVDWITITSGSSGTGNGTVKYSVKANKVEVLGDSIGDEDGVCDAGEACDWSISPRTGSMTIAGETFTVTQNGAVIVLTPNGGEVIPSGSSGSPYPITWEAPAEATIFDLMLSFDNGSTWKLTANNVTGTSYPWTVPKPLANQRECLIKVIGYDASDVKIDSDKSDSTFTIEVVRLTAPSDPGIFLTSGDSYTITWTTNDTKRAVAKVKLFFTKNGGITWERITTFTGSNPGSFNWLPVPEVQVPKPQCKIKVELLDGVGNVLGQDVSDNFFTINPAP